MVCERVRVSGNSTAHCRDNMGFPIVECTQDGQFVLSKPPNTGGLVSFGCTAEQVRLSSP